MAFVQERIIDWGDCDPAGIVFYPNYFRWIDATFHALGRAAGFDQTTLAQDFGLRGTPLVEARLTFRAPARYHDRLAIAARITRLGESGLTLAYDLAVGDRRVAEGTESRVFVAEAGGRLSPVRIPDPIRTALEPFRG
jgi:YbgC/YbaW family acyl-CoA thioester hydrolase